MKIGLSTFTGIGCGYEALKQLGIKFDSFYSSEIDEKSIMVLKKNHPEIKHLGDITKWPTWNLDWENMIYIDGGSPCQGVSNAGKRKGLADERSALFFVFNDLLNHVKKFNPDVKFLFENVRMNKKDRNTITRLLGVEPIKINSSLVSAQNRERLYWTNIPNVTIPEDRGIMLDSIIPGAIACHECGVWDKSLEKYVYPLRTRTDGKSNCITTTKGNTGQYLIGNTKYKNSIELAEQLQTLPIGYTYVPGLSETARYKMVGNAWTVEMIKHILKDKF